MKSIDSVDDLAVLQFNKSFEQWTCAKWGDAVGRNVRQVCACRVHQVISKLPESDWPTGWASWGRWFLWGPLGSTTGNCCSNQCPEAKAFLWDTNPMNYSSPSISYSQAGVSTFFVSIGQRSSSFELRGQEFKSAAYPHVNVSNFHRNRLWVNNNIQIPRVSAAINFIFIANVPLCFPEKIFKWRPVQVKCDQI